MSKELYRKYTGVGAPLPRRIIAVGLNSYLPGKISLEYAVGICS